MSKAEDMYNFKGIIPNLLVGTASDRYEGWRGQIYLKDYSSAIKKRQKSLSDTKIEETVLPVQSVTEYFEHFDILEIDFTFYGLLVDSSGKKTSIFKTLNSYAQYINEGNKLFLKVPQVISARKIYRNGEFISNESYLNPQLFAKSFYEPCLDLLGDKLIGLIFEQEYHSKNERIDSNQALKHWKLFFEQIPSSNHYHLELRTYSYITSELVRLMTDLGVGIVLSHWTWLPTLREQFRKIGEVITNRAGIQAIRLMTPRNVRYEEAYKRAYPFDRLREDLLDPKMIDDTVYVIKRIISHGKTACVIINNRAGGNAPEIARLIKAALK